MRRWNPDWSHALLLAALTAALGWNWEQGRRLETCETDLSASVEIATKKLSDLRTFDEPGESGVCMKFLDPRMADYGASTTRDEIFDLSAGAARAIASRPPFSRAPACSTPITAELVDDEHRRQIRGACEVDPFYAGMLFYDQVILSCGARR